MPGWVARCVVHYPSPVARHSLPVARVTSPITRIYIARHPSHGVDHHTRHVTRRLYSPFILTQSVRPTHILHSRSLSSCNPRANLSWLVIYLIQRLVLKNYVHTRIDEYIYIYRLSYQLFASVCVFLRIK